MRWVLAICLPLGLLACGSGSSGGGRAQGELLIFAGRSPPRWTLTTTDQQKVRERLTGLTAVAAPADFPEFGKIGYAVLGRGAEGLPDRLVVSDGIVQISMGGTLAHFHDDKDLATLLRDSATAGGAFDGLGGPP